MSYSYDRTKVAAGSAKNVVAEIARKILLIKSLETRNSGEDFHECAVWQIKKALTEAYEAGLKAGIKAGQSK